jgi:hypothetical protein
MYYAAVIIQLIFMTVSTPVDFIRMTRASFVSQQVNLLLV